MLVLVVVFLFGALMAGMTGWAWILQENIYEHRARLDSYYVERASDALRMRLARTGGLGTVSLTDITSTDEGFRLKSANPDRLYFASATNVSDGVWRFDRALVYSLDDDGDLSWDPLAVSSNTCSATQGFATSASWCGPSTGVAYDLIETRETYLALLTDEAMRMQVTLQKLGRGFSVMEHNTFPRGPIAIGNANTICAAGGGPCVNTSCVSPVMLNQTPLDCSDQFSRWGQPVVLNVLTAKHVALVSTATTVRRAAGTSRQIARELRVPLMSQDDDVLQRIANGFLRDWGWSNDAPEPVRQFALTVARLNPTGEQLTGKIVCLLGHITEEQVESRSHEKPNAREPYFQYLTRLFPQLSRYEVEVMAVKDRLPYYAKLPDTLVPHPLIASDAVRDECEKIAGLLTSMPSGDNCLIFSSYEEMLRYRQRGVSEEAVSPLATGLKTERRALRFAFAPRAEVITPLRNARKDSSGADTGAKVGRLYYADRTRGPERNTAIDLLETGISRKATDLSLRVLETGEGEIYYRENGIRLYTYRITLQDRIEVTNYLMQLSGANPSGTRLMKPKTGRMFYKGQNLSFEMRCSFIPGDNSTAFNDDDQVVSISMRYLPNEDGDGFVDIDGLSFVPAVKEHLISALNVKRGIILLVGPTNSGKSTTLAAFLGQHYLIFGDTLKRLSLEDPKERTLIGVEQFSLPSSDVYEPYLEGFLRHDPDVILLSEIRSRASAEVATRAALTGHLVLSTFHATEPVEGYTSLAHLLSEERQNDLLQALVMIITQRLVPRLCPVCSVERVPTESEWSKFRYSMALRGMDVDGLDIQKNKIRFPTTSREKPGHTCDKCNATGFVGVYPVHGILDFTKEVKKLLRQGQFEEAAEKQAFTLERQAIDALHAGLIDLSGVST